MRTCGTSPRYRCPRPKGMRHRPVADETAHVLLIEHPDTKHGN
jgi:hypothetical protein